MADEGLAHEIWGDGRKHNLGMGWAQGDKVIMKKNVYKQLMDRFYSAGLHLTSTKPETAQWREFETLSCSAQTIINVKVGIMVLNPADIIRVSVTKHNTHSSCLIYSSQYTNHSVCLLMRLPALYLACSY